MLPHQQRSERHGTGQGADRDGNQVISYVTSADYGYSIGKLIMYSYLPPSYSEPGTPLPEGLSASDSTWTNGGLSAAYSAIVSGDGRHGRHPASPR